MEQLSQAVISAVMKGALMGQTVTTSLVATLNIFSR